MQVFLVIWLQYRARGIENLPDDSGALLVVNHQSSLDPLLVGLPLKRPVSWMARNTLFRRPLIGWILRNTYVMPINRKAAGTESFRLSLDRMKAGYLVGLFPEGTRGHDGEVGLLKPGFIALARRGNVPIIPVGIAGAHRALPKNAFFVRPARVRVYFGEPIPVETVTELAEKNREEEFIAFVRERIIHCSQMAAAIR
ncbi:lysophospholipid acyltransferase family protein [Rubinisphaera margarita]|uniref:lysophospholipid acyltransferase family protein n=1 Tax=Rubinisphaera margarita TaxID=2909586 RepID=UPI001EE99102|nr:lysophospholipid acyltransferase family protein [Rubinisphaera margarita]MCG6155989.1 1-acyl-sn-glycerol-3-phosphate acyltransferase [Rubinisphaera margarita]